jgi:hypothetical protein
MEAPRIEKPDPDTGILGVGCALAMTQVQFVCAVQDGFLHAPPIQTNPDAQSVFSVHDILQSAATCCCGYGVLFTYTICVCGVCVGVAWAI